jgi:hypothetical protein
MNSVGSPRSFSPVGNLKISNAVVRRVQNDPFARYDYANEFNGAR